MTISYKEHILSFMKSQLSPEAPIYIPPPLRNVTPTTPTQKVTPVHAKSTPKEPQCSRYSRKSVRLPSVSPNSVRPILGTKRAYPRPILGRRSDEGEDEAEEYIGTEFRSISRNFSILKLKDEPSDNVEDGC